MTPRKRIFLNIAATYGRSLFALACGLFTGRWLLAVLGTVDYGLYGLVGGLVAFITFFNSILSAAIARFYAYSVGESQKKGLEAEGLEKCRSWFNTALSLHACLSIVLVAIGYPIGAYAIEHWLTIPPERISSCIWVFRCVCVTAFIGMFNVPFSAMYVAKQLIAELTIYSIFTTTANVVTLYYMVNHPGEWLALYAMFHCGFGILPQIIIVARALLLFPECKIRKCYLFSRTNFKYLSGFVSWQLIGHLGQLVKGQGIAILVNKMFGPTMNAAMAVGATVSAHTDTLAGAMNGAFMPAITTKAGSGDLDGMRRMALRACKFGAIMSLFFILPLSVELREILGLWLVTPPPHAVEICYFMLALTAMEETMKGVAISITANGKLSLYYSVIGIMNMLTLPIAWLSAIWSGQCLAVLGALVFVRIVSALLGVRVAQRVMGFSMLLWLKSVILKNAMAVVVSLFAGFVTRYCLDDYYYWGRIVSSLGVTACTFCLMIWFVILDKSERLFFVERLRSLKEKFR